MADTGVKVRKHQKHETNVKETIESIIVAFILAFIFRAFVVEAFLIPTGSMATTLLGAHLRLTCPNCGQELKINASDGEAVRVPNVYCDECGSVVRPETPAVPIHRGDRILVLKYLYEFQSPRRWDVVVFKSPHDPEGKDYQENYIKRLIGLPGETVAVLDGDVYTHPGQPPAVAADADLAARMAGFRIQRKTRPAQDALWRLVHDNDRVGRQGAENVWEPQSGRDFKLIDHGRTIEFTNVRGKGTLEFHPERLPEAQMLRDHTVYDVGSAGYRGGMHDVSDLKLSVCYERREGTGPLRLKLRKYDDWFIADVHPDRIALLRNEKELRSVPLTTSRPLQIDLINADYRVTVRVNGADVLATDDSYGPNFRELPELMKRNTPPASVQISAEEQTCVLSHISLWRDGYYYTNATDNAGRLMHARPEEPLRLGADQYFVMGDNPAISLDARMWYSPIDLPEEGLFAQAGVVPRRFMIGRAFFVYWPAGYRPFGSPVGFIPNFGEMRFIH